MSDRSTFPRVGDTVTLTRYAEGNVLSGDQSGPNVTVTGLVVETPHPSFGSSYLSVRPPKGAPDFAVAIEHDGDRWSIGPWGISLVASEAATSWTVKLVEASPATLAAERAEAIQKARSQAGTARHEREQLETQLAALQERLKVARGRESVRSAWLAELTAAANAPKP